MCRDIVTFGAMNLRVKCLYILLFPKEMFHPIVLRLGHVTLIKSSNT